MSIRSKGSRNRPDSPPRPRGILNGDRQLLEALVVYGAGNIVDQGLRLREFADPVLGCDLPDDRCAYQHLVSAIAYQPSHGWRQLFTPFKPPDEGMAIQKKAHKLRPGLPHCQLLLRQRIEEAVVDSYQALH